ncbi:MAG: hypothetical protein ABIU05_06235 [Nitrospirales bacterium]
MAELLIAQINKCIYCGSDGPDLTDEHVIPLGLLPKDEPGLVLGRASCNPCSAITSAFERAVLRRLWLPARAGLGLRSYRKRKIPREYPISVIRDGIEEEVMLPLEEFPATLQLIEFQPPVHFTKVPYESRIVVNASVITQVAGPPVEEIAKKLRVKTLRFKATFERDTFERLILKIAHGFAVSKLGLGGIEQSYVLPALLGQRDDMGRWLGCDGMQQLNRLTVTRFQSPLGIARSSVEFDSLRALTRPSM